MSQNRPIQVANTTRRVILGFAALFALATLGCANDPVSRKRIQRRNAAVERRIYRLEESEARHPARLEQTMKDISRDRERKKAEYRESIRTAGDRFW